MPRMPRGISLEKDGRYHLRGQVAGGCGYYPLQEDENAQELLAIVRHYTELYCCQVAAVELLGSHYHLALVFAPYRKWTQEELHRWAECFYPGRYRPYLRWNEEGWTRFNRRLYNVSELMRNIQQGFARWFNRKHRRKGAFWAGRFQLTETEDLRETVYYVELNAVRAGLVKVPEQWRYGSAWLRKQGRDAWLLPLTVLLQKEEREQAHRLYWEMLYWRGTRPRRATDAVISVEAATRLERAGLEEGCYLRCLDPFSRGGQIGSRSTIEASLRKYRETGLYRRRRYPVPVGAGGLYSLRGPRSSYLRV